MSIYYRVLSISSACKVQHGISVLNKSRSVFTLFNIYQNNVLVYFASLSVQKQIDSTDVFSSFSCILLFLPLLLPLTRLCLSLTVFLSQLVCFSTLIDWFHRLWHSRSWSWSQSRAMLFVYFLASPTAHDQLQAVPPPASLPPPPTFVALLSLLCLHLPRCFFHLLLKVTNYFQLIYSLPATNNTRATELTLKLPPSSPCSTLLPLPVVAVD